MKVSYDKLWRLMKDNRMKKKDLAAAAQISSYTMARLGRDEYVPMEVMARFCKIFHCGIGDVMELSEEDLQEVSNG